MTLKKISVIFLLTLVCVIFYKKITVMEPICKNKTLHIEEEFITLSLRAYRRINSFCDSKNDWKIMANIINKSKILESTIGDKYCKNYIGTKNISPNNDETSLDIFNGEDVILYFEQDTLKKGALKELIFLNEESINLNENILEVSKNDKFISKNDNKMTVKYYVEYDEINLELLRRFQKTIHCDSTLIDQAYLIDFQLISKKNKKCDASLLYEDRGARFYFTIH